MVRLSQVVEELVEERGLDKAVLSDIIREGMLAAYEKKYPDLELAVNYNKKTDEIEVEVKKRVVSSVTDEDHEISLRKARNIASQVSAGDELWVPFEGKIGRIEILRAKQVISAKIRSIEAQAIYNEFKDKQGTIVLGVVHKCERNGATIKIGETLAFLPSSLSISGQKCVAGFTIRALLKEVLPEPRGENQLILDRASSDFIIKLFELEILEVFEGLVEIKKVVRIPGYKTKIIVASNDKNIDPVGSCVGVGGVRIRPLLKELGSEKIDVIAWSDSSEELIKHALKPAVINRVELIGDKEAHVWLDEDQRSVAIGKMGQNIMLASRLVGREIRLIQSETSNKEATAIAADFEGLSE
jgi:transcription termination/antitermination protein NusA